MNNKNMFEFKKLITRHEGRKNKIYPDTATPPNLTGGVGHELKGDELKTWSKGQLISDTVIDEWLNEDIAIAIQVIEKLGFASLENTDWVRYLVLCDMAFNMGINRLKGFKNMLAAIKTNDWAKAAKEGQNSAWFRQTGVRAKEDMQMMSTGVWILST